MTAHFSVTHREASNRHFLATTLLEPLFVLIGVPDRSSQTISFSGPTCIRDSLTSAREAEDASAEGSDQMKNAEQMNRIIECWALAERRATHLCAFETLGLNIRCGRPSKEVVKKAWHQLCMRLHPDKNADCDILATEATRCINLAKQYLFEEHFASADSRVAHKHTYRAEARAKAEAEGAEKGATEAEKEAGSRTTASEKMSETSETSVDDVDSRPETQTQTPPPPPPQQPWPERRELEQESFLASTGKRTATDVTVVSEELAREQILKRPRAA